MIKLQLSILRVSILLLYCVFFSIANALPDADMPIYIRADKVDFNHKLGFAKYQGNVIVDQGSRNLRAQTLTIQRDAQNRIQVIVATGTPATFKSQSDLNKPPGTGSAKTIKYYPKLNKVKLFTDATLTQNGDTITAPKLTYNIDSEELQGNSNKQQRTTIILQPKRAP